MIKNKIYIYNYLYIKLEFYLNLIIIENDNKLIHNVNLNFNFFRKKLINKFFIKFKMKANILCLNYFNYNILSQFIKSNNLIILKNIYSKKYIKKNILLDRFNCFFFIFINFKNLFFVIFKFFIFIKKKWTI